MKQLTKLCAKQNNLSNDWDLLRRQELIAGSDWSPQIILVSEHKIHYVVTTTNNNKLYYQIKKS